MSKKLRKHPDYIYLVALVQSYWPGRRIKNIQPWYASSQDQGLPSVANTFYYGDLICTGSGDNLVDFTGDGVPLDPITAGCHPGRKVAFYSYPSGHTFTGWKVEMY